MTILLVPFNMITHIFFHDSVNKLNKIYGFIKLILFSLDEINNLL